MSKVTPFSMFNDQLDAAIAFYTTTFPDSEIKNVAPSQCGWITDQFGITWQIVPRRFMELISDQNPKKVQRVMDAMMEMVKLDLTALEMVYEDA
jgi:predicted 3-demethylubiquinone-9 3-methyltransferase (glyoxalase superfamily)